MGTQMVEDGWNKLSGHRKLMKTLTLVMKYLMHSSDSDHYPKLRE